MKRLLLRDARIRLALAYFALLGATALLADCLASDQPVLAVYEGELYVLPCLTRPAALAQHSLGSLAESRTPGNWLIAPPVGWAPNEQDKGYAPLAPPSARHWLGTDTARRDVLARLVHGSRAALLVGLVPVLIYVLVGSLLGLCAGYCGGITDVVISRLVEIVMTVPVLFLLLAILGLRGRGGLGTLVTVLALVLWPRVARLVRAEARRVREQEYVRAAEGLGLPLWRVMLRHVLPNAAGPIFVAAAFGGAAAILIEASLTFLGFGTPDHVASWGSLMHGAMEHPAAWWLVVFPGAAIFATVTVYNLVGEALRDVLDPRAAQLGRSAPTHLVEKDAAPW